MPRGLVRVWVHVSNEKKAPGCVGYFSGMNSYSVIFRDYFLNHEIRIPSLMYGRVFVVALKGLGGILKLFSLLSRLD